MPKIMNKPEDFFIGIVDFFSVFIPGSALTFSLKILIDEKFSEQFIILESSKSDTITKWIIFIVIAYFIGHLVFGISSKIDDFYNSHRKKILDLDKDKKAFLLSKKKINQNSRLHNNAREIIKQCLKEKKIALPDDVDYTDEDMTIFRISIIILDEELPSTMLNINRFVADSKFFRSIIVILPVCALIFLILDAYIEAFLAILLILPCYYRYFTRRLKSTTYTYQSIIIFQELVKQKFKAYENSKSK